MVVHPSIPADGRWIDDFVDPAALSVCEGRGRKKAVSGIAGGKTTNLRRMAAPFSPGAACHEPAVGCCHCNFPPLTLACCFWKAAMFSSTRVIGWSFNFRWWEARARRAPQSKLFQPRIAADHAFSRRSRSMRTAIRSAESRLSFCALSSGARSMSSPRPSVST